MSSSISVFKKHIEIKCNDDESRALAFQIPYVHFNRTRTVFKTTIRNIDLVLKLFRNIDESSLHTLPEKVQRIYHKEMRRRIETEALIKNGPRNNSDWLFVHQQLGREIAQINDSFAFFYDTRTGKTPMSLQIIADDIAVNPDHKWLVLCPLILIENAWLPDSETFFPNLTVVNLHDSTKAKRLVKYKKDANIYINNIESFVDYQAYIKELPIYGCIVDESSTMKSHKSQFGKEAVKYAYGLERWYLLSGTPAPNGEWEYYRQLQSIDFYGIHQSYTQFKEHFFTNISYNPQFEKLRIKPEKNDELLSLLRKYSLYVDKEDVLTTPGREFIQYTVNLPKDLRDNYEHFRKELYLEAEGSIILANSTGGKYNKLNQISSGFIIDTEAAKRNKYKRQAGFTEGFEEEAYFLSEFKIKALDKLLQNIGEEQCIIWANYHKEFDVIKKHLGDKCGLVYGKVDIATKNKVLKDFKEGKVQYLVANPASANKGLTLTNAHFNIYYSMNYSYELWKQSIERIYGDISKQKNKCFYYIIIAKDTIDEVIYSAVRTKGEVGKAVLDHLKGMA